MFFLLYLLLPACGYLAAAQPCSEINTDSLCARAIAANCIKVKQLQATSSIRAPKACFTQLKADQLQVGNNTFFDRLCANEASITHLCATRADIGQQCSDHICADLIETTSLSTHHICANNVEHCTPYKAWLSFANNTMYNLGDEIDFDTIVDDPNGNVALGPTRYIAPKSGYYVATLGIGALSLTSTSVIAGIPVTRPEIVVNGLRILKAFEAFLSFATQFQNNVVSGIIHLNAGDEVTARYRIFAVDTNIGAVAPVPGEVLLEGPGAQGQQFNETFLRIHYLSSDCAELQCQPCVAPCQPCSFTCTPVDICCCEEPCDLVHCPVCPQPQP